MQRGEGRSAPSRFTKASLEAGFTLLALLALTAMISLTTTIAAQRWVDKTRHEREHALVRIANTYASAIAAYRDRTPGGGREYPATLDDLLLDTRYQGVARHLRQLYPDPLDPGRPWGLVRDDGGHIVGVYSNDDRTPFATVAPAGASAQRSPATTYADWKFIAPR